MTTLGEVASIHRNMSWADFWIVPSGQHCGNVVRDFDRGNIGVMFSADAVFKQCVMPNKIMIWFDSICKLSGHPPSSVIRSTEEGDVIDAALLRKLRLPTGAVPDEANSS